ncbi:Fructosamine kinase-domain-containing protein [Chaetomium strumarium]|uniref:protein-ribulosamine 3-kinase n=1 Tax=Chaetomium strumarium TaxID=1170767 RepID=A0AAJ0GVA7_9PEZI|nr:Fructosamine kinase-domain-containing protein [Chaetomium strumarium]
MTDRAFWIRNNPIPVEVISYVDQGVRDKLPPGTQIEGISPHGVSYWSRTAMIEATDEEGNPTPFFIKVNKFELGKDMVSSEYFAMTLLHSVAPEMSAEPLAWGAYTETADTYFLLARFHEFSDDIPDQQSFPKLVAEFHQRGASKTGEFGFPITMYGGRNPQTFPLCKSWEQCFSKGLEKIFDMEEQTHGPDEEMRRLREGLMTKVIPRLLRPLETEGRTLTPTLVHGNLWDGNASVDVTTGHPMFYDSTPLYAHNEYELGPWWPRRHRMSRGYIQEYRKYLKPSQPIQDFDDRVALYALRFDLHASSLYPGNLRHRHL